MTAPTVVPVAALAALVGRERAGQLHLTLQPQPMWYPDRDRDELSRQIDEALAEAGLLDHTGRTKVEFLDLLPLLTSASIEFYGWATRGDETIGLLAASRGMLGVLAVRSGAWVTIREVGQHELPEALVAELPELYAGGGRSQTVRVRDFEDAARGKEQGRTLPQAISDVVKVVQRPVHGTGELYAGKRDEVGRYARVEQPLHYADTDWGRYLNYTVGDGPEAEIHVAPATPAALADVLRSLSSTLTPALRQPL
ncbi:ESX secretion-associated protein EspG [Amycolatopsis magusensis]|uniref:ESX secretion-associated protein EspG n=1 Tax=Amycolatopsis magusensis TaxID=882444 RepID=UPI003C2D1605